VYSRSFKNAPKTADVLLIVKPVPLAYEKGSTRLCSIAISISPAFIQWLANSRGTEKYFSHDVMIQGLEHEA
jgi:phosphoheptose isomerase